MDNKEKNLSKKDNKFLNFLKSKKARRGSLAILLSIVFIAIVVALNIVSSLLIDRFPSLSLDLTQNSAYQLQKDTTEYLSDIEDDVTITVLSSESDFENRGQYYVQANKLLQKMPECNSKIEVKYVDLTATPTFTQKYPNVDWNSSSYLLLVESGDDYRALAASDMFDYDQQSYYTYGSLSINGQHVEQATVTAILNVTTKEKIKVTLLSGQDEEDASAIEKLLTNNAYDVETVSLLTDTISEDSKFLVIYAPKVDLEDSDKEAIENYLYNDGNYGRTLLFAPNDRPESELTNFNSLLLDWGIETKSGLIFETDEQHMTNTSNPYFITIMDYENNDLTSKLKSTQVPVVMLYTVPLEITDSSIAEPLLTSSDKAVLMPFDADENWDYQGETQQKLNGAVWSKKTDNDKTSNVIAFGSYDALSESALSASSFNNSSYILNIFNTLANRDEIGVTIEGKSLESTELGITSTAARSIVLVCVVIIIPLIVIAICIIVLVRRRLRA